jgi:hypothetical protein
MMLVPGTLLLTRKDVAELMPLNDCVQVVDQAFRLHGEGRAPAPGVLGVHAQGGGFHIKTGTLPLSRNYFAAKTNANFPGNPARGLPTIQGVILLFDADNGQVLAAMDNDIKDWGRDRGGGEVPGAEGFPHRDDLRLREPGTGAIASDKACLSAGKGFCLGHTEGRGGEVFNSHGCGTWDRRDANG